MAVLADIDVALTDLFNEIDKLEAAVAGSDSAAVQVIVDRIVAKKAEIDTHLTSGPVTAEMKAAKATAAAAQKANQASVSLSPASKMNQPK